MYGRVRTGLRKHCAVSIRGFWCLQRSWNESPTETERQLYSHIYWERGHRGPSPMSKMSRSQDRIGASAESILFAGWRPRTHKSRRGAEYRGRRRIFPSAVPSLSLLRSFNPLISFINLIIIFPTSVSSFLSWLSVLVNSELLVTQGIFPST